MSDYVWGYVDRLARELYKTHPDRKVSGLSYGAYTLPPEKSDQLSPNLALVRCQTRSNFYNRNVRDSIVQLQKSWLEKLPSKEMYVYEYYLQNCASRGQADIPVFFPRLIAEDLRSLKGISRGDMIEVYRHPDTSKFTWDALAVVHLNIYVTARLWWDTDQDLDALLDEYYTLFYGPAAKEMKAFVEYSETNWPLMSTKVESIDRVLGLLTAAREAAGDTIYGQRVDLTVNCLEPLKKRREKLAGGRKDVPRAVAVERKGSDLHLDGKLDETFWKEVPVYNLKQLKSGEPHRC